MKQKFHVDIDCESRIVEVELSGPYAGVYGQPRPGMTEEAKAKVKALFPGAMVRMGPPVAPSGSTPYCHDPLAPDWWRYEE